MAAASDHHQQVFVITGQNYRDEDDIQPELQQTDRAAVHYDEVFAALRLFINYIRFIGLLPFPLVNKGNDRQTLDLSWTWRWMLYQVFVGWMIFFYVYSIYYSHILLLANPVHFAVTFMCVIVISATSAGIVLSCMAIASRWPDVFRNFTAVDAILEVRHDVDLRRYGRRVRTVFPIYMFVATVGSDLLHVVSYFVSGDGRTLLVIAGITLYETYLMGILVLWHLLFGYFCYAIVVRLRRLVASLDSIACHPSASETAEVSEEMGKLLRAYSLMEDTITFLQNIFGTALLLVHFYNIISTSSVAYICIKLTGSNYNFTFVTAVHSLRALSSLAFLCLSSSNIHDEKINVLKSLQRFSSVKTSSATSKEIVFFITYVKNSSVAISALGFISFNKQLLLQVTGYSLTYVLSLLELDQTAKKTDAE